MGSHAILSGKVFRSFKTGDEKSFRLVHKAYSPIIRLYVLKFTNSTEDTEEIVHEAFVTLYLNRHKLTSAAGLYPYLFTVAKRLTISDFRKKVSERQYQDHLKIVWRETTDSVHEFLSAKELKQALDKVVGELPPKQREVYLLNKEDDLSYQEISSLLGISINTVRNHLVVAVKQIKLRLAEFNVFFYVMLFFFNSR